MSWPVLPPGRSGATWATVGACFLPSILKADVEIAPMHSHPPGSDRDATRDLGRPVFGSPGGSILLAPLCYVGREGTRAREGQGILAEHGRLGGGNDRNRRSRGRRA